MNAQKNATQYRRPSSRGPEFLRVGLVPGILAGAAILGGMVLHETEWFITIRFAVSILCAILIVFAWQGRNAHLERWKWITYPLFPLLAAIVVLYNPISDLTAGWHGQAWMATELVAAGVAAFAALFIKTPAPQN